MQLGMVGLGRMGQGMARRILDAGHDLCVYDVAAAATEPFKAAGARVAASIRDVAVGNDVVVSMLVEDSIIREVAFGPGGLCESLPKGAVHVVMGTHGVAMVRELEAKHAAAGQTVVAAPVLGGIALGMTECETVNRAGTPGNVAISAGDRGQRRVMLTYLSGPWPGIYHFADGRLKEIDRAPTPPEPPKAPPKKKAGKAKKKPTNDKTSRRETEDIYVR